MEIGQQIKKLRIKHNFSQDELADKIYVSRQTISNWENNKSYPDVKSLLLISNIFQTSLDTLVKGDIEEMKKEINENDIQKFSKESVIFTVLFLCTLVLPIPLSHFFGYIGCAIWIIIFVFSFYYAGKIEKLKKNYNIQTYKEIVAFEEGRILDNDEKNQELGKRFYQKLLLAIGSGVITILIAMIMMYLLK